MAGDDQVPLINSETIIKVSSTLEKATGKKNLIDDSPETCWTSQQVQDFTLPSENFLTIVSKGLPQFIQLTFDAKVIPSSLSITFQGGFVGTNCTLFTSSNNKDWKAFTTVYPEDVNRRQIFKLEPANPQSLESGITTLKLVFEASSDFFGRITIYDLKLHGRIIE